MERKGGALWTTIANFYDGVVLEWNIFVASAVSKNTASNLVQRYLKTGLIQRVRRNLYVVVDLASGVPMDNQYVIASNITPGSYVSYHSAFSYRGCYNQILFWIYVSSPTKFNTFTFQGLTYRYMYSRLDKGVVTNPDGVRVTDLERTIIDNIDCFEGIGGGLEELLECLSLVPNADEKKLQLYLDHYDKQFLYQKTGYILEYFKDDLNLSPKFFDYCASKVGSRRYLHRAMKHYDPVFNKRWQLYVPEDLLYPLGQGCEPDEFI